MTSRTGDPSRTSTLGLPSKREIRVERVFDAPREHVWRAMTEPDLVAQWWGRGNRLDVVRLEVERGGHWRFVEHHDGATDGFEGRFREVTPPERIVQTFEWDGMPGHVIVNDMTLEEVAPGRTRVIVVSLFHTTEERDGMLQSGMKDGLDRSYDVLDGVLISVS
jgi:uncharacterized protein YndB with AHSA1/START domain